MNKQSLKQPEKPMRNSSIELLRILSILMIVFHHFAFHGGFQFENTDLSITRFWYNLIVMGGKLGVDIFIFISGYFLVTDNNGLFNIKKTLRFWGQVFFYSVTIFAIFIFTGLKEINLTTIRQAFFPLTYSTWWFASVYFILFLIHPFLNIFIHKLDKKSYQIMLIMFLLCGCIIPTFFESSFQGNNLTWFFIIYFLAGYIRLYGLSPKFTVKHYAILAVVSLLTIYILSTFLTLLGTKYEYFSKRTGYFNGIEKLPVLIAAVCIFMLFSSIKIKSNVINRIATTCFGVYLIHDHPFIRRFIWDTLFKNATYQNSLKLIPYSLIVVLSVYAVCAIIDFVRQHLFEKPFMKVVDKKEEKYTKTIENIVDKLSAILFGQ